MPDGGTNTDFLAECTSTQRGFPCDCETHYMNIERQCLSVCLGLEKFHTYIYRRHVIIENDHKLLEMIQHKPIHAALPRLQWMPLHMQKYDYTIQYKSDKDMVLADHFSHFPSNLNYLPIPLAQISSMPSSHHLTWILFKVPWNVTQCIAPSIA